MANTEKIVVQVVVKGGKDLDGLTKKTGAATKSAGGLTKSMAKMAGGVALAAVAFKAINSAISGAIKTFTAFEFQMAKVKAIAGANNIEFKALTESAQELGRTTFFTATQVAELQGNFAKLGFTTDEIMKAQEATLLLATATGSDLARAAIVAGSAVRGFNLDADQTQRVVDLMAVAFTSSALDIEKWQTSMTKIAPIAAGANISIETSAAIMGKLSDAGIEASIAGTSLRNIFLKLQDSSSDLSKHLGFTVNSSEDFEKALKQLNAEGLSNEEIMGLVDLRQVAAFKTMVDGTDSIIDMTDALENSSGAGAEMAAIVGDNLEGAFKRLKSAVEGLEIAIMDGFIGKALRGIVEKGAEVLNFLTHAAEGFDSINNKIATSARIYKAQGVQIQSMADRFDVLSKNTKKTADEEAELQGILVHLQKEFGRSVVSVNKKTNSLRLNRSALDDVISRTALLADTEALKLVHKLKNTQKEIALEKDKKDAFDGTVESITSNVAVMADIMQSQAAVSDQVAVNNIQYDEFGNVIDRATNNSNDLLDAQESSAAQSVILGQLKKDETLLTEQLTEAGWSALEIDKLLNQEVEKAITLIPEDTTATGDNTKAKLDNSVSIQMQKEDYSDYMTIMQQVLDGTINMTQAEELLRQERVKSIETAIAELERREFADLETAEQEIANHNLKMQLEKELIDLKVEGQQQDLALKQEAIDKTAALGSQLIQLAGQDKKMQGIRKAGVAISAAAAVANNILALSNMNLGVAAQAALPFPSNIIAMAGTLTTIISMIANLKALKDSFGDGGVVEAFASGGMVQGKSHAQGGEKFAVGGRVVELEGGEAVINKRSTSMFRSQLSAMNSAGGGVKFADGGMLNQPSFSQQQFNALGQNQMMSAMGGQQKVVVVEADITDSQNSVSVIESLATV